MGVCIGKPNLKRLSPAPDMPPDWSVEWDVEGVAQSLKMMEFTVSGCATDELAAVKPCPNSPDPVSGKANEWNFDIFHVPYEALPALAYSTLSTHPCVSDPSSQLDHPKLWRYVCEIAARYHARPFHNFRHAVDVLLATSALIRFAQADHPEHFTESLHVAALLVAALVHDTDHPGVMNSLLIAKNHPVAKIQGVDKPVAVLENHHAAVAIALLRRSELDFLCHLPSEQRETFIRRMKENVLCTDVTTTISATKSFSSSLQPPPPEDTSSGSPTSPPPPPLTASAVASIILKAADISNPSRDLPVYKRWIAGVMSEFFVQGDTEREAGLPISMNCDRYTVNEAKAQVGFISFLVLPLFRALAMYAPAVQPVVTQLESNLAHFQKLAESKE